MDLIRSVRAARWLGFAFVILWIATFGGCRKTMIAEASAVKFDEISEITTQDGRAVRLKGFIFHSSLAVEHIEQHKAGKDVNVDIFLTPVRSGLTGNFTVDVPLTDGIERILFGSKRVQVWPTTNRS